MTGESEERLEIAGLGAVSAALGQPRGAWAMLALAPGAGSRYDSPFLVGLCEALRAEGVATLRFHFPYTEGGRRMPGPPAAAISTWTAALAWARERTRLPVWAAGKSYGGRMASMAAAAGTIDPAGLVYLGYPLHPPGRPDQLRVDHLPSITAPQVFLQGTNDPFVVPHEQLTHAVAACPNATIEWIEGAGHSFEIAGRRRPADGIGADLAPLVVSFLRAHLASRAQPESPPD